MPTRPSVEVLEIGQALSPVTGSIVPAQRVGNRLAELVIGQLPGGIAELAGLIEQHDVEALKTGLVGREHVDAAAGILLTVERVVVLEHEHRNLRGRVRQAAARSR